MTGVGHLFDAGLDWVGVGGGYFVTSKRVEHRAHFDEDVHFLHPARWASGMNLFSRLSWADHLRNTRIAYQLKDLEPLVLLDIGCGAMHPIGVIVEGLEIDTLYVGLDGDRKNACEVPNNMQGHARSHPKRPAIGLWHDAVNPIPMRYGSCDMIVCLEAMEHFIPTMATLEDFFADVDRLLKRSGTFILATPVPGQDGVLMHPHCHIWEHQPAAIHGVATGHGFKLDACHNYRARPDVIDRIQHEQEWTRDNTLPIEVDDVISLPYITGGQGEQSYRNLVPGNALYYFSRP